MRGERSRLKGTPGVWRGSNLKWEMKTLFRVTVSWDQQDEHPPCRPPVCCIPGRFKLNCSKTMIFFFNLFLYFWCPRSAYVFLKRLFLDFMLTLIGLDTNDAKKKINSMSNVRQCKVFLQTAGFLGFLWGAWTHPQPPRSHISKSKHTQDSHGRNDAGIADKYVFKNEQFLNSTAIIKNPTNIHIQCS